MSSTFNENGIEINNESQIITNTQKHGKHYFISYDERDEILVIENFVKCNNNFLLLKTKHIELFDSENSFCFDYNNIDLNSLFLDYNVINTFYAEENKIVFNGDNINCIHMYMIPNALEIIDTDHMKGYIFHIGRAMVETISRYCAFEKEIILDDMIFLKFSREKSKGKTVEKDRQFLVLLAGIGDFFITFSIVHEYLENNTHRDIYIANRQTSWNFVYFKYMVDLCYGEKVKLLNLDVCNRYFTDYWVENNRDSLLLKKITGIFDIPENEADHAFFLYKKCLMGEKPLDCYRHSGVLQGKIMEKVGEEEKKYINGLVEGKKYNIGFQYFTGAFNVQENKWYLDDRKWDGKNVKKFIAKCKKRGMNLIALNYETYEPDPLLQGFCTKKLSIPGYALLISKMDLVVGMDSSPGHIASFYGVPSITLWGKSSPLKLYHTYVGYRALRKNYSIIAKNGELSSIGYRTVFSAVKKFAKNKLRFKEEIITYQNSADGYNVIYT